MTTVTFSPLPPSCSRSASTLRPGPHLERPPENPEVLVKTIRSIATAGLLLSLAMAGCEGSDPTQSLPQDPTLEDDLALEILADPSSDETALDLATVQASAASNRKGWGWGAGTDWRTQAERCFQEARQALAEGDRIRAREKAREGRQLVAQTIELAGGQGAIMGLVERLEGLPATIGGDPDAFTDQANLRHQLGSLGQQAREALGSGDPTGAGALAVLGEQAFRHRHRSQTQETGRRADLAVDLAEEAVVLAQRLMDDQDQVSDTEQLELLAMAQDYLSEARRALEAGQSSRAAHLAHLAQWWALKAVVVPGGITDEDVGMVSLVAGTLLEEAAVAVEADPSELALALLARATRMFHEGGENVGNGSCRGLGALWQAAVISAYLLP